jgi:hypothetical protein
VTDSENRPVIRVVDYEMLRVAIEAEAALARVGSVLQREGRLVRRAPFGEHYEPAPVPFLRVELSRAARFVGKRGQRIRVPGWLPGVLRHRGKWPNLPVAPSDAPTGSRAA